MVVPPKYISHGTLLKAWLLCGFQATKPFSLSNYFETLFTYSPYLPDSKPNALHAIHG